MKFAVAVVSLALISVVFQLQSASLSFSNDPIVVGHRGAMGHVTENTLESVHKAIELGADVVEIDVFKIKSGEIVVFHDQNLERLTNAEGYIENWQYRDLKNVTVEGGYKIPRLQDVLDLVNRRVRLNVELKGTGTTYNVNHMLNFYVNQRGWRLDDFVISSFKWDELRAMRALNPNIPIAILTGDDPLEAIPVGRELNAEAIYVNFGNLNVQNYTKMRRAGFKVYVWTVDDPTTIASLKDFGIDGIITNYPDRVN